MSPHAVNVPSQCTWSAISKTNIGKRQRCDEDVIYKSPKGLVASQERAGLLGHVVLTPYPFPVVNFMKEVFQKCALATSFPPFLLAARPGMFIGMSFPLLSYLLLPFFSRSDSPAQEGIYFYIIGQLCFYLLRKPTSIYSPASALVVYISLLCLLCHLLK